MGNQQLTYGYDIDEEEFNNSVDSGYDETTSSSTSSSLDTSSIDKNVLKPLSASTPLSGNPANQKSFFVTDVVEKCVNMEEDVKHQAENVVFSSSTFVKSAAASKKRLSIVKSKSIGISIANARPREESDHENDEFEKSDQNNNNNDTCEEKCACKECDDFNLNLSVSVCSLFLVQYFFV